MSLSHLRWDRLTRRAAIAACATILLTLYGSLAALLLRGSVHIEQGDFLVYYSASRLVLEGHGSAIYQFATLKAVETSLFHSLLLVRSEAVFLYPPFVALMLAPLASLPYATAFSLWFVLNAAILLLVLLTLRSHAGPDGSAGLLFVLAGASFFPVFASLAQGQVSILLLALLAGCYLALSTRREYLGGVLLALVLLKPPYVIPFVILLLVQRRWRALGGFTGCAVVLVALPMGVLGPRIDEHYLGLLARAARWHTASGGFSDAANQNLAAFFRLLVSPEIATGLQAVTSLMALAAVAVVSYRSRQPGLPFAAATVVALLINPHVLIHDLSLLLLPAAISLQYRDAGRRTLLVVLGTCYLAALASFPLTGVLPVQLPVVAMAAALLWLLRASRWDGGSGQVSTSLRRARPTAGVAIASQG